MQDFGYQFTMPYNLTGSAFFIWDLIRGKNVNFFITLRLFTKYLPKYYLYIPEREAHHYVIVCLSVVCLLWS